jgi:hypothetical protein
LLLQSFESVDHNALRRIEGKTIIYPSWCTQCHCGVYAGK